MIKRGRFLWSFRLRCHPLTIPQDHQIVAQHELERIRSLCVNGVYLPKEIETRRGFVYGQRVSPQSGPLAFHVGRYDGVASKRREAAMFSLFGREQRIMFKAGVLLAA